MAEHEALAVWLGNWRAEGTTYGGENQSPENPRAEAFPWRSFHTAEWYSGEFFVVQDERATGPFNTLSILGWDGDAHRYFARTIENHGFARDYTMTVEGRVWTLTGEQERARYEFSEDGGTQTITWEIRKGDDWLPLCDRIATKIG